MISNEIYGVQLYSPPVQILHRRNEGMVQPNNHNSVSRWRNKGDVYHLEMVFACNLHDVSVMTKVNSNSTFPVPLVDVVPVYISAINI